MTTTKKGNSFGTEDTLTLGDKTYHFHSLKKLAEDKEAAKSLQKLPFSLKILLENLLRHENGVAVQKKDIEALLNWNPKTEPNDEIQFVPARVLLQDFTGVPAVADLAAMRGAIKELGGDPNLINPLQPADLVIDHSVQVDQFGTPDSFRMNAQLEFQRNSERYQFLKWGQTAFKNFSVVPPDTGIVHQINLEFLACVAMQAKDSQGKNWVYPDTLVGTDSHTTMINGLGVLGWGVGGIEAEAALLGQPCSMLIPNVVGFKFTGHLPEGATATDLVLTVTQMLRKKGVVGKFVEFYGPGLSKLSLADRATLANMAPEYGATIGIFPIDEVTLDYLRITGRGDQIPLIEAYFKEQGLWYTAGQTEPSYSDKLELDLGKVEPCLAGPTRPQDRVALSKTRQSFRMLAAALRKPALEKIDSAKLDTWLDDTNPIFSSPELDATIKVDPALAPLDKRVKVKDAQGNSYELCDGSIVIAAITSCTNTSNPQVLMAAGLLAKKAVEFGLKTKPWVKTSLAPGSTVVTDYFKKAGLTPFLEELNFHLVGYGCTTCIGNSGPLPEVVSKAVTDGDLAVAAVLSGNRNFEGRINTLVKANYLASPPLVVAYALAGNISIDLAKDPLGLGKDGRPVYLKDIWPSTKEVTEYVQKFVTEEQFKKSYSNVFEGQEEWRALKIPTGELYKWDSKSTYIKEPPFFHGITAKPATIHDIKGARVLAFLGDSVTTDHISPAGSFSKITPAGQYLQSLGVAPKDFNSYGSRRGNHEVMVRGTFANVRIKNLLVPGVEGGVTTHLPSKKQMSIYDASMQYQADGIPLMIIAGKEYGTGSSRDWAAKGPKLLGIYAVIAESFERIHRSNLVGMGILPLQFLPGESATTLGLTGRETFDIENLKGLAAGKKTNVVAHMEDGSTKSFSTLVRIDTPNELEYYIHGGILPYVLRHILSRSKK